MSSAIVLHERLSLMVVCPSSLFVSFKGPFPYPALQRRSLSRDSQEDEAAFVMFSSQQRCAFVFSLAFRIHTPILQSPPWLLASGGALNLTFRCRDDAHGGDGNLIDCC